MRHNELIGLSLIFGFISLNLQNLYSQFNIVMDNKLGFEQGWPKNNHVCS